ncbi:MAG: hypothetical protein GY733_21830, partial [bacterium]|nr:hypothetical protein [bacterium]
DRALGLAKDELARSLEPPGYTDADGQTHTLRLCVLGLGKLGASELNYSSDVDLVYLCDGIPEGCTPQGTEPTVYFTRLAQAFGKLLSTNLREGFLYRVDLELRPNGKQGALVVTDDALVGYYESWAHTWEKAAFMKARPVAGDLELGWNAIMAAAPAIYQATMNYGFADGIRSLKSKITSVRGGQVEAFNVKIDPGGIRDVEFIAQVLQLLHGGRIPQLRDRSTQGALQNLEAVGLLPAQTAAELRETYLFLRRVENRLQMEGERQVHRLPKSDQGLLRLARAMNYMGDDARERFLADLERHRRFLMNLALDSYGEGNHERVRELFTRTAPQLWKLEFMRPLIEELIDRFAASIDEGGDAERSLNNLDRFLHAVGARRFYFELLLDRPELVSRLAALFGASNYLSSYLARYPRLIEPLFRDPDVLLLDREALAADYRCVLTECAEESGSDGLETQLDALRLFHHRHVVNVGLLDLDKKTVRAQSERALSDIGEVCIQEALEIGRRQIEESGREIPEAA